MLLRSRLAAWLILIGLKLLGDCGLRRRILWVIDETAKDGRGGPLP
jgi:hypothetical protein